MQKSWFNNPTRYALVAILVIVIVIWQWTFDLAAYYRWDGSRYQYAEHINEYALDQYEMSLRYYQDAEIAFRMGRLYEENGDFEQAAAAFENALAWNFEPRDRPLRRLRDVYQALGRNTDAAALQSELDNR